MQVSLKNFIKQPILKDEPTPQAALFAAEHKKDFITKENLLPQLKAARNIRLSLLPS